MDESNKIQNDRHEQVFSTKHETTPNVEAVHHHAVLMFPLKTDPVKAWGHGSLYLYGIRFLIYLCSNMNVEPNLVDTERFAAH